MANTENKSEYECNKYCPFPAIATNEVKPTEVKSTRKFFIFGEEIFTRSKEVEVNNQTGEIIIIIDNKIGRRGLTNPDSCTVCNGIKNYLQFIGDEHIIVGSKNFGKIECRFIEGVIFSSGVEKTGQNT